MGGCGVSSSGGGSSSSSGGGGGGVGGGNGGDRPFFMKVGVRTERGHGRRGDGRWAMGDGRRATDGRWATTRLGGRGARSEERARTGQMGDHVRDVSCQADHQDTFPKGGEDGESRREMGEGGIWGLSESRKRKATMGRGKNGSEREAKMGGQRTEAEAEVEAETSGQRRDSRSRRGDSGNGSGSERWIRR